MRNTYSVLSILLIGLFFGLGNLKAQSIDIINTSDPANPVSLCQCDTLGIQVVNRLPPALVYFIGGANFSPASTFYYELASPNNNWSMADSLDLTKHEPNGSLSDTFDIGTKTVQLAIPCDAPLGPASLRVRNSNGVISDTIYYIINRVPDPPAIDTIIGGFPNPYTNTTPDDYGFCTGDSIQMVAETQVGASYQWLLNGVPMAGETGETLTVKNSGLYALRVDLGACALDTKDTLINAFLPPTDIDLVSSPPVAFHIDNPNATGLQDDSVQFCATETVLLEANTPGMGVPVNFSYQWITDSVTQFGDRIYYKTDTADTLQTVNIDSTNIEDPSEQRFYVVIDDGFCRDTSQPFYFYMDTIPRTPIINRKYKNGVLGPQEFGLDVCMKDSVILRAQNTGPNWEYQWQRLNTVTGVYQSLPNAANPNLDGTLRNLQVDTSIKPIAPLSWYRLVTTTVTPQGDAVCTFISDTIKVRWFPEYDLTFQPDPWVFNVGQDSINFCETDSAVIIAPTTPNALVSEGYFYQYQWLKDTLDTTGATVQTPIVGATSRTLQVKEGGRYYVIIDDGICVDTSDFFRVFVDSLPQTSIVPRPFQAGGPIPDLNLCLEDSLWLSAVDTILPGWEYEWQYNSGIGWSSMQEDTLPFMTVDTAYAPFGGDDTVYFRLRLEYENRFGNTICPFITDSVEVIFFNPPDVSFFPDDTVTLCAGDSVLVIAQGNSNNYAWDDGTLGAQNYLQQPGFHTVTGTGTNGCTTSRDVFVQLFNTQADAGPDVTTSSGSTVSLSGSGGTDYRWYSDKPIAWSDFLSRNVDVSYTLPEGIKRDTVTIYLQVTNTEGCTDTDSLQLIVGGDPSREVNVFTPNDDGLNDVWDITSTTREFGVCDLMIMNRWGSVVYEEEEFDGIWEGNDQGGNPLPDGTYYYVLSCDGEVILKSAVTLIRNQ